MKTDCVDVAAVSISWGYHFVDKVEDVTIVVRAVMLYQNMQLCFRFCSFHWISHLWIAHYSGGGGGGALWMLVAQLLFCQKPVIHLFLGCEPRLHSSLPHTGYKDIVSFCGAAQTWVLQKCCLICFWFEVLSRVIVERKATAIMGVDSKG